MSWLGRGQNYRHSKIMSSCEIHFWYILGLCLCCRTLVVVISQYRDTGTGTFSVYLLCYAQMFTKTPIMLCFPTYYAWHYAVHISPPRNSHCMYLCVHNTNYNIRTYINPIMLALWFTDKFAYSAQRMSQSVGMPIEIDTQHQDSLPSLHNGFVSYHSYMDVLCDDLTISNCG